MVHPKSYFSLAVLLAQIAHATLNTLCWRSVSGEIVQFGGIPCGVVTADSPNVPCCNTGNLCLSDGICQIPGIPNLSTGFSNYYTAGCTDSTYKDPSCNPYCRDLPRADIVYNNVSQIWSCCGTEADGDTVNCNSPSKEIFSDPAPANLSTTFTVASTPVTSISSSTSSAITTGNPSPSPTFPSQTGIGSSQASSGLSAGAKAGIGVGVAVVAIAVLAGGILLLRRKRRNKQSPPDYKQISLQELEAKQASPKELGAVQEVKMAELHSEQPTQELP